MLENSLDPDFSPTGLYGEGAEDCRNDYLLWVPNPGLNRIFGFLSPMGIEEVEFFVEVMNFHSI
jgi:hypothetical protein